MKFHQKLQREHKLTDLASLPPCKHVLLYHAKQVNMIAYIWRKLVQLLMAMSQIKDHGWLPNREILWMAEAFPDKYYRRWMTITKTMEMRVMSDDGDYF